MLKKTFFKIIVLILGFFLNSCELGFDNDSPIHLEYGIPFSKYTISGFVHDNQNTPIQGIEIIFQNTSTYTNLDGSFSIVELSTDCWDCKLSAIDIDGYDNGGKFKPKEFDLNLNNNEQHDIEIILDEEE